MSPQTSVPSFDDRLMHLGLDLLLQRHFAFAEDLLNVGAQFARFRIDDLELFLNSSVKVDPLAMLKGKKR